MMSERFKTILWLLLYSFATGLLLMLFTTIEGVLKYLFSLLALFIGYRFFQRNDSIAVRIWYVVLSLILFVAAVFISLMVLWLTDPIAFSERG